MIVSNVKYLGNLRTESTHLKSGNTIITDAPIDNNGKGEAFSPTDLVATSLCNCMITLIGITANKRGWEINYCEAQVEKEMASDPRRIKRIGITLFFEEKWSEKERKIIENAAKTCPVAFSLHPDIVLDYKFIYDK